MATSSPPPQPVVPEDEELLQHMVLPPVNEAIRQAAADSTATMGKLTGGLNLGGLL